MVNRRKVLIGMGGIATATALPASVSASDHNRGWKGGFTDAPGEGAPFAPDPDDTTGNRLRPRAEPVELEPGDVEEVIVDDPEPGQAEVFWVVRHGVEYERSLWREPSVFGNFNVELGGSDFGSFWFGILGPDLSYRFHEGQVIFYMEDDEGDWHSLTAQFTSRNRDELLHVNGVEPE